MSKVVLITGASSGLGLNIAQYLGRKGHLVFGTSRKQASSNQNFTLLQADVTDSESMSKAVERIIHDHGKIDVLINNAGLGIASPIETVSLTDVSRVFDTNVTGVIRAVQAVLPIMHKQGNGLIINISSIGAEMGLPYRGIYSASKAAVERITEALRTELSPYGIQACSIQPGGVRTDINKNRLKINLPKESKYRQSFERTYEIINKSVDEGLDPAIFSMLIAQIIEQKQVRQLYRVGKPMERISVLLKRILPSETFENMIKKHYGLK